MGAPTLSVMADAPLIGSPTAICTHHDGQFSVEFGWERAPDALWLRSLGDLMKRSGRESVDATTDGLRISFRPQDADEALDDLAALLEEADRQYRSELEQRDEAVRYVQGALLSRYGQGPNLPVREI